MQKKQWSLQYNKALHSQLTGDRNGYVVCIEYQKENLSD